MKVAKFTVADAPFERTPEGGDIFIGNVVDEKDGGPITVGFGRYAPDQKLEATIAFDEATIVTKGRLTVRSGDVEVTAGPGEVVYLPRGAAIVLAAHGEGAEIVYVTYPHWKTA